jgi:hypothetical protein
MSRPENTNLKTGTPNFYKLSKPIEEEGVYLIIQQRALGFCISGFVIRFKALELERAICEQMNKHCFFRFREQDDFKMCSTKNA